MDREHVKGAADKAKGAIKDTAGRLRGTRNYRPTARWTRQRVAPTTWQAMSKMPFARLANKEPQETPPKGGFSFRWRNVAFAPNTATGLPKIFVFFSFDVGYKPLHPNLGDC